MIKGFQKLTLLDYPGKIAAIIFTGGCNFRCPYCHNASLLRDEGDEVAEKEIFDYFKKRKGIIDGVVVTGGEPLIHEETIELIKKLKAEGLGVKLDTNGSFPEKLKYLIENKFVDYIAMDIKTVYENYSTVTDGKNVTDKIKESVKLIMSSGTDYEFRTTIAEGLHTEKDIIGAAKQICGAKKFFLQNFKDSGDVLCSGLKPFSLEKMQTFKTLCTPFADFVDIR